MAEGSNELQFYATAHLHKRLSNSKLSIKYLHTIRPRTQHLFGVLKQTEDVQLKKKKIKKEKATTILLHRGWQLV